jgi:ribose 1,5-bisphosphokinase PhnN
MPGNPRAWPVDDETMNQARKSRRVSSPALCEDHYGLQLARGSSHIASTLTPATRASAIAEVIEEFEKLFGLDDLLAFLEVLAQRLEKRGAREASDHVNDVLARTARRR